MKILFTLPFLLSFGMYLTQNESVDAGKMTHDEAVDFCSSLDAHLPAFETMAEWSNIREMLINCE